MSIEIERLERAKNGSEDWKKWGPYLSERQWGTVREDYSDNGDAWNYFPHDHARSRAYRWGEDGLAGVSDRNQILCFSLALWNGADPILKERLFGLSNSEGNHGEDVKEYYFYLDCTPTHSYMKYLYKYPQQAYPYSQLIEESRLRSREEPDMNYSTQACLTTIAISMCLSNTPNRLPKIFTSKYPSTTVIQSPLNYTFYRRSSSETHGHGPTAAANQCSRKRRKNTHTR